MHLMSKLTIARNAAALMVSDVAIRALSGIGVVLVARSLGPSAYGVLSVALAFSGIVAYLSDLGLTHLTIQHATRPNADIGCILSTIFKVRLVLVITVALVSVACISVLYPGPQQRTVMLAVVLPSICGVAMQGFAASYFWATQELHVTAGLKIASQVFSAIALILAFLLRWPVSGVAAVYGTTSLLGGVACLWLVRRRAPKISGWDPSVLRGLTAFTVGGLSGIALPQLGPLILQRVATATQVGYFAAASRIPGLLYAIPGSLGMAWYPQLFHAGSSDPARHFALSVDQLKLNAILSFGLSLPVALYSGLLIRTVLGSSWEASTAPILPLLCWMVVLNSFSTPFADALTTKGLQTRRACVYVAAMLIGSALFAALGSTRGAQGAAAAAITTQLLLSVGLVLVNPSGRALLSAAGQRFLRPVCAASASVFVIRALLRESMISAALSVAAYFLIAVASDTELRTVAMRSVGIVCAHWRYACTIL
jgi:O-antigen/teichoic acid export membrane protein